MMLNLKHIDFLANHLKNSQESHALTSDVWFQKIITSIGLRQENMAKSIRSKRKRKMRAIKRVRYAEKELARLKKTLGIEEEEKGKGKNENAMDIVEVSALNDGTNVSVEGNVIEFSLKEKKSSSNEKHKDEEEFGQGIVYPSEAKKMDVVSCNDIRKLGGRYPKWMNQRQIHRLSRHRKQIKTKLKKVGKLSRFKKL